MSSREEFEKTMAPLFEENLGMNPDPSVWHKNKNGSYLNPVLEQHFVTWQAARATPALPQGDEYKHAKCPGHDAYAASQALPQGVEEWMPILGTCLAIPMKLLDESQAKSNHGQTPARLKERGGISLSEAVAIAGKMKWRSLESKRALEILHDLSGMALVPVEFIHVLQDAPEINTSNYDHDQVCRLNTAVNEALAMLTVAKEKS